MGVNTYITLPGDVRLRDVADVIGICAGLKPKWTTLSGGARAVSVDGVSTRSCDAVPECAEIDLVGRMIDGERMHNVMFHFEFGEGTDKGLLPRATPFWIAIGVRLVNFFGGEIDFADCDDDGRDHAALKPRATNRPSDGEPWQEMENAMYAVTPITETEYRAALQFAAYEGGEYWPVQATTGVEINV